MASLLRFARQGCRLMRPSTAISHKFTPQSCCISTSKKNKDSVVDAAAATGTMLPRRPIDVVAPDEGPNTAGGKAEVHETVQGIGEKEENWISFGYDFVDRDQDEFAHHTILFFSVTLALVCGGYYLMYAPDYRMREWSQREAYLELARREAKGLPLVDGNLIDVSKITLPPDEDLADVEIVV
ncbi:hypothetical protein CAPTEDRAFT_157472 [Capitella teleta]|uniref:NADH dehydrogenase [ubiquinone] 1 beta subcomplex subunit 11, mitochondrial n=1 Tax=Capitella teleta TaxID=283909 RepID=R7VHB6_CAPTE|nr:hypothetical protein CAPTEDRAFT_157472 [Capitella teleta]|eukprot:ELU17977.1 hypothetical protein CAPTEDRAFT_157472 [Capitella teleta]